MPNYLPRLIDDVLQDKMELYGAVLLEGCKWCGKSTTAQQKARTILDLQDPATHRRGLGLIDTQPEILLRGDKPLLIDEWQDLPYIWDVVRHDVDQTGLTGQYLLTGSATPATIQPRHSGIGRIVRLLMRPMSLFESGDSTGEVSLTQLFAGQTAIAGYSSHNVDDIAYLCARGGWPAAVTKPPEKAIQVAEDYLNSLVKNDIGPAETTGYNSDKMELFLRSLARHIATPVTMNTLISDIREFDQEEMARSTAISYLSVLHRLYILDDIDAWSPRLRSRVEIRSRRKRNFVDPSLAVAALYASPDDLINDLQTFGFIFESLVLRDLQIYLQHLKGRVCYYRDKNNLECDAVLHRKNGQWALVEVKLGSQVSIDEGVANLLRLRQLIDTDKMHEPSFLMIITGASHDAYIDKSGVLVVPIGCLRP